MNEGVAMKVRIIITTGRHEEDIAKLIFPAALKLILCTFPHCTRSSNDITTFPKHRRKKTVAILFLYLTLISGHFLLSFSEHMGHLFPIVLACLQ